MSDAENDESGLNLNQTTGRNQKQEHSGEEPSLQEHHDPETEEDTASGGAAAQ